MQPLKGMRVVDFGQGVAGPYCAMLLGDFGADVIKVEPFRGDWSRSMGSQVTATDTTTYLSVNRNKRSIRLDLSKPAGRNIARALVARGDVLVESFRPGVMDRMELGFEALQAQHPRLIYCSVTGYGPDGPYADAPAGDSTMQAVGGLMSIIGEADGTPLRVGNVVSDMLAGMHAFEAVLLSTLERGITGKGGRAQVSLFDTILAFQAPPLMEFLMTGQQPQRTGNSHPLLSPSGTVRVIDGLVTFTVLQHQWGAFCSFLGSPQLADDPRFATNDARVANRAALMEIVQSRFSGCDTEAAVARMRAADVLCAPVNSYPDIVADPQVLHNRILRQVAHRTLGEVPIVANPIHLSGEVRTPTAPPGLGEHTREILTDDLNMNAAEINQLISEKAVGDAA
jgi:crotonobetainyl-CoA:carnitine CoA-transferase CaiB-like acyl-CoA transferase